jgi:hypothetical protein
VEHGAISALTVLDADAVCRAVGATLVLGVEAPVLVGGDRQRDAAHAACVAYVARRLEAAGWLVAREVEIGDSQRPGWIDLMAFDPDTRTLLVIEVKTLLADFGGLERQLGWYERRAADAAGRLGWRPAHVGVFAFLLATTINDRRIRDNALGVAQRFPVRWRDIAAVVAKRSIPPKAGWGVAMVDPRSKARTWSRPTVLDGRRSAARYRDTGDFGAVQGGAPHGSRGL